MLTDIQQISTDIERQSDLEFAAEAVAYLEKKGLHADEVVDCLIDECDIDRDTARALVALAA